jgi:hypothetical protein
MTNSTQLTSQVAMHGSLSSYDHEPHGVVLFLAFVVRVFNRIAREQARDDGGRRYMLWSPAKLDSA